MQPGSADAVLAAIAQSSNEVTQGWMRLMASAPASAGAAPWLADLLGDVQKGRISQTDERAFEVGRNLAVTPGHVVYENELIQLIQYAPTTAQVAARPLVMVPPCINKYYVLDLQPENSFVAHAVASGNTVFMLSWRNAGPEISHLTWDDYLDKGVLTASRAAREICGSDRVNALGFCVGGTLLGALVNCGVPVDLGKVKLPVFVLSTREDHIVPWRSAYRTLSLLGEEKTFVLGASGHIAGIVNPPATKRRSYWVGEPYPDDPDAWLKDAREERGSWWPFWSEWLARQAGGTRAAPSAPGSARYRPVEPAPGRYVKQKAN